MFGHNHVLLKGALCLISIFPHISGDQFGKVKHSARLFLSLFQPFLGLSRSVFFLDIKWGLFKIESCCSFNSMIVIGSDHGGLELKRTILEHFTDIEFLDLGTKTIDAVHYPVYADALCSKIMSGEFHNGILICGTGIGICMRANRYPGIRAALVYDQFTSTMAKAHNNANVICLGGRTTPKETALMCIETWLSTAFEGGRHAQRLNMLDAPLIH
jgi:ribose 5-phosphate isomerase B